MFGKNIDKKEVSNKIQETSESEVKSDISEEEKIQDNLEESELKAKEKGEINTIREGLNEPKKEEDNVVVDEFPEDPEIKDKKEIIINDVAELGSKAMEEKINSTNDPIIYEALLDNCIKLGKSTVEKIMLSIISGVINGKIEYKHLNYYKKYINSIPPIAYLFNPEFSDEKSFKKLANKFSGWGGKKKFKDFYWSEILKDKKVIEESEKAVSILMKNEKGIKLDRDHANEIIPAIKNPEIFKKFINDEKSIKYSLNMINYGRGIKLISLHLRMNKPQENDFDESMQLKSITYGFSDELLKALSTLDKKLFKDLENLTDKNFNKFQKYLNKKYKISVNTAKNIVDQLDQIVESAFKKTGWFKRRKFNKLLKKLVVET